jgi:RNA polymerase sigma-70 factor (ECF subfamily)
MVTDDDSLRTRASLLVRLRDARDRSAWGQFVEIYTPLIHGFCRARGLQEADAADVCQEVLRAVSRGAGRFEYNPAKGKFRNWLFTVVRSKLNNFFASHQRRPDPAGPSTLAEMLDAESSGAEQSEWDAQYHRHIFNWAAERIRPEFQESTWQAFWQTTVEEEDGKQVAQNLGLSVGAVYVAKSRVLARLRVEIQLVEEEEMVGLHGVQA